MAAWRYESRESESSERVKYFSTLKEKSSYLRAAM